MGINRKNASIAIASVLAVGALAPSIASAKSVNAKLVQTSKVTGIKLVGTATGTFGKCKAKGTVTPPKVTVKYTCKGGTITFKTNDAKIVGSNFVSTAKLSGTGKYKKIKGSMKGTGSTGGGPATFKGKVSY